ncbi:MAG: NADPH-dependent reductase [Frankiales bacterium]|nr:NADPH-dependent reductase [Frankiales bacterium]
MNVGIVVGNPKPKSRTYEAALHVLAELTGREPSVAIDVVELGPGLLGWGDAGVAAAVESVKSLDLMVIASPTYKATYTGLLKLFLDQFGAGSLGGAIAIPLMLGAGPAHALAPELSLKPVLVEIGASTPTSALYLLDSDWKDSPTLAEWLPLARKILARSGV